METNPVKRSVNRKPKKRFLRRSTIDYDLNYTPRRFRRPNYTSAPQWYNRSFFLHLSLRQDINPIVDRKDLLTGAFELNKKVGAQLNLPILYGGKDPYHSAANLLSQVAASSSWIQLQEPCSRKTSYRLPVPPIQLEDAAETYQLWCRQLAEDWKIYFKSTLTFTRESSGEESPLSSERSASPYEKPKSRFTRLRAAVSLFQQVPRKPRNLAKVKIQDRLPIPSFGTPMRWSDIVQVTNKGVFAVQKLPANTPIGFYYGAPMTEDEFDALKYREGRTSDFCLMYKRAVLDATDIHGQPVTDITSRLFCPFHFMNETVMDHANVLLEEGSIQNQIVCWTRREIQMGEELNAWFGCVL